MGSNNVWFPCLMRKKSLSLSWQAILLLAALVSVAVGLKALLVGLGGTLSVPQIWDLSLSGSLALILMGSAMSALLLGHEYAARSGGLVAVLFGVGSLFGELYLLVFTEPSHAPSSYWLSPFSAILLILIGGCCARGLKTDSEKWWLLTGWFATAFGSAALIGHLSVSDSDLPLASMASQASKTMSVFAVCLGLLCLKISKHAYGRRVVLPGSTIVIAAVGISATLLLVYVASVDRYGEQRSAGEELLTNLALTIEQSTAHRTTTLQRMADRWAFLGNTVQDSFYLREAEQLVDERPALRGFLFINPDRTSNWRYAVSPTLLLWMEDQLVSADVLGWIRSLREGDDERSWYFPDVKRPDRAIIGVRPSDDQDVVLLSVIDLHILLNKEVRKDTGDFDVAIFREGRPVTAIGSDSEPAADEDQQEMASHKAVLPGEGGILGLKAYSNAFPVKGEFYTFLPVGILLFGLALTYQLMISRAFTGVRTAQAKQLHVSEQRFRSLFDQNPEAVLCFDAAGCLLFLNPASRLKMDLESVNTDDAHFHEVFNSETVPVEQLSAVYDAYDHARAGNVKTDFVLSLRKSDGNIRKFDASFLPVLLAGEVGGVFCVARDITERLWVEERQRIMERSLEASSNAVIITDARLPGYPVMYVNPAFMRITGFSGEEVRDQTLDFLIGTDTSQEDVEAIKAAVFAEKSTTMTIRSYRKDGTPFWNQLFVSPVRDEAGAVTHFIAVMNDISEQKEHDQQLAYQATHDVLTGLGNRSLFNDRLAHDFELAKRNDRLMAVLFIDLDDFKPINDALGHKTGDKLLISVAERLSGIIRGSDTLARFGGDEFVLLLPELASPNEAEQIAQRVLEEVARPHVVDSHELHISASVGISIISEELNKPEKLLQQADMAMYKAKQQGRDAYELYSCDLDQHLSKRVSLRNDLQDALNRNQLFLQYQPLVSAERKVVGIEALVRWHHPEKGNISPAEFIPLAEETGQIIQIGRWVLQQACADTKCLVQQGLLSGRVAVNLSPMQFHRPNFLTSLRQVLEESELPSRHLELELTEGILMKDSDGAIDILNALNGMGVSTAIDDFGTGFSSFSYLRELPVQKVKVDKSFVDGIADSERDASVCKGIIGLARELYLTVVAEGVENRTQFEYLKANGCEVFQGYYFARPMAFDELVSWVGRKDSTPMQV